MGWFKDIGVIPDPNPEPSVKRCGPCQRERDEEVELEARQQWLPGRVVDTWECPECGTAVLRNENEEWV